MYTNKIILWLLDRCAPLYTRLNIKYEQLRAIIEVKLLMDGRRQSVRMSSKRADSDSAFLWTLVLYVIFGAFVSIALATTPLMLGFTIFFSFLMVMIVATLITDFSSILLDTSDNSIILPRPIDGRTFYAARLTHVLLYLGQVSFCLTIFPIVTILWKYGILLFAFFIPAILLAVFTSVFLTNFLYLLLMRLVSEERLKAIINYFQIGMTIFVMGGYQIGMRSLTKLENMQGTFEFSTWSYFIPSVWLAAAMQAIHEKLFDLTHIILSSLAVIFPLAALYVTNKWLTPFYNRKIATMGSIQPPDKKSEKSEGRSIFSTIGKLMTGTPREEGAFSFVFKMLARDNKIKLKIYPGFGLIFVFAFIFLFNGKQSFASTWANLPHTSYYVLLVYLPFMVVSSAIAEIPYSDDFKASWIYYSAPIGNPGEILSGMAKAVFVQLFVPVFMIISIGILFVWGIGVVDDILFGLINNYLIFQILLAIVNKLLPLSMPANARNQSGNLLRGLLMILCTSIPGIAHYFLSSKPIIMIALVPFQLIAIYFMHKSYRSTGWSEIKA